MSQKSSQDERAFYNTIGSKIGWDFQALKVIEEGVEWRFYDEVRQRCRLTDLWLDIGIGGGEKVLELASSVHFLIGIDQSEGMLETARQNLHHSNMQNVRFVKMDSHALLFPNGLFNGVSSRHAPFHAEEVFRVLMPEGLFLHQGVSEADKMNLKAHFGRGQNYQVQDGTAKQRYMRQLQAAGFSHVAVRDYDAIEYYSTPEDLIFLLTHTPIIPNFGHSPKDFDILEDFITHNNKAQGIQTNSKRYLIIAEK